MVKELVWGSLQWSCQRAGSWSGGCTVHQDYRDKEACQGPGG